MDSVDITWRCPKGDCLFTAPGDMDSPYAYDDCPMHPGFALIKATVPPPPRPPAATAVPPPVGDMMSFLATDRAMGTLSAIRSVLDAPQAKELWNNQKMRDIIAGEWDTLRALMKDAGFK